MDLGIRGLDAIVCASSRGLGKGCALALAEAGCNLVINGRDASVLAATAEEITRLHDVQVKTVVADVSTLNGQQALLDACPAPSILINNNGGPPRKDFAEIDRDAILDGVVQNMITPIELIKATIDTMADNGFGRIVNITSMSVVRPISGLDVSSGARAGLTAFLAGVCRLYTDKNVTINNLLPGKMETRRLMGGLEKAAEQTRRPLSDIITQQKQEVPANRFGTAEEFGQTCAFLCSRHAGYITGQNILMDGGLFNSAF